MTIAPKRRRRHLDTIERYVPGGNVSVEDVHGGKTHGLYVDSFLAEKDKYASFMTIAPKRRRRHL